ncbi:retrotransposon protein, putative, ty1-copia subclass [Tanacetum coccineum]
MGYAPVPAPPFAPKPKNPPTPKKDNPAKDAICHQCGEVGHWRRNCPVYLAELLKKKKLSQGASTSGIFTIELYSFPSTSWVYDTGCGTHICITTQGLRGSRKLKPGALSLYVGDGHRAAVEAIGEFHLCLPSGLVLILHNCHYAPSITRGIISVSRLYKDGFVNRFENDNTISVSRNNLVYFYAIPRDAIYEIDLSSYNTNDSSIVTHKKLQDMYESSYSTNIKSIEKCVSCMSGKMARKPYSHQVERAKDLLGLIHTDVCGPFRTVSRQGASYFVTFTDDFSRYGYVYLLKHKHEVFETFKVFQKEVENQLGKTIKSLHSDRGGEYMSQEFLNHLKEHGIIAHRTPPYTPQHNGVSERRNRTLLDMVRSMMSQTTLPKSFWDYALESAARILNMVPTKKVEKTPYEVWHGQAPELSYLNVWGCEALVKRKLFYLNVWGCEALVKRGILTKPDKLEPISIKCIFVGYPKETMGYSFYYLPENKIDMDGVVHTYKAHLVAKGFTQTYMVDYEETFSPVTDIRAIRILIAMAAFYDYEIWQMDVKTSFLNEYLSEEVYMVQPEGFVNPKFPNRIEEIPAWEWCFAIERSMGKCNISLESRLQRLDQAVNMKAKLCKSQGASTPPELKRMHNIPYASAVGSIMYAVRLLSIEQSCDDLSLRGIFFVLNASAVDLEEYESRASCATSSLVAEYIVVRTLLRRRFGLGNSFLGLALFPD